MKRHPSQPSRAAESVHMLLHSYPGSSKAGYDPSNRKAKKPSLKLGPADTLSQKVLAASYVLLYAADFPGATVPSGADNVSLEVGAHFLPRFYGQTLQKAAACGRPIRSALWGAYRWPGTISGYVIHHLHCTKHFCSFR